VKVIAFLLEGEMTQLLDRFGMRKHEVENTRTVLCCNAAAFFLILVAEIKGLSGT
jgi:hypothetical protein